jgi:hypothetical protein
MQQAIKTLVIFCLIMSITPTRLSIQNKGIGKVFSMVGRAVDKVASHIAIGILSVVKVPIDFSYNVTENIVKFFEGYFLPDLFGYEHYPKPVKTTIAFLFLPVSIIYLAILYLQIGIQHFLEMLKFQLRDHLNPRTTFFVGLSSRDIELETKRKVEFLKKIIEKRLS